MQEEQIRAALNRHWQASAAGDANAEHDIYEDDAICDYPQSGERILGRDNFAGLAESSSRPAVRLQGQADSRKRGSVDHGIHHHVPGARSIHGEYYGVPQRQGGPRNTVFRGSLRGAGLAQAMGSADRVTPRRGWGNLFGGKATTQRDETISRFLALILRAYVHAIPPVTRSSLTVLVRIEGSHSCFSC
jgi:hypothetical protein